jgi:hypothetical protein
MSEDKSPDRQQLTTVIGHVNAVLPGDDCTSFSQKCLQTPALAERGDPIRKRIEMIHGFHHTAVYALTN